MTTHPTNVLLFQFPFCLQIGQCVFDHLKNTDGEINTTVGSSGRVVERRTVNRGDGGLIPPTAISKLRQFCSPHICLCLSEETQKDGGPFYLVSVPVEVKDPTQGVNV